MNQLPRAFVKKVILKFFQSSYFPTATLNDPKIFFQSNGCKIQLAFFSVFTEEFFIKNKNCSCRFSILPLTMQ